MSGALAAAALSLHAQAPLPEDCKTGGFAIGCQAYTFNQFSAFEAIEKTAKAGGKVIEFYPGQKLSPQEPNLKVDHNASADVIAKLKAKLAQHNLRAVNYGVVGISRNEAEARKVFEFARTMGMRAVTTESADAINTLEKLAREYDIAVGFHNHPGRMSNPGYKIWNPLYVAGLLEGRDARLGAAADTGHWLRSNLNPLECLRILKGRIVSSHLKDLNRMGEGAHDVPYGKGVANVKAILDELKAQGFQGNISIEYEYNWENNVPEVTECIDFVRNYGSK
ncbi:MAG: sugar phosphate isomerase/epimerase [Verrucomicrobia bacterium]|nr:sugar phosphate isomerase/epimerase [Verrucomicrobiota bacterium]